MPELRRMFCTHTSSGHREVVARGELHNRGKFQLPDSAYSPGAIQSCRQRYSRGDQRSQWIQTGVCFYCWWILQELIFSLVGTVGPQTDSPEIMRLGGLGDSQQEIQARGQARPPVDTPPMVLLGATSSSHTKDRWRMALNNQLQANGGAQRLQYVDVPSGPAHKPTWHCIAHGTSDIPPRHSVYQHFPS